MISVHKYAGFAFVVEKRAKIDSTYDMPTSFELFLKPLFDVLGCVFEIGNLVFDHLDVDVLSYEESVFFHLDFHIAKFDIC